MRPKAILPVMIKAALLALLFLSLGDLAWASGDAEISWRQDQDCALVERWELYVDDAYLTGLTGTCGGIMTAVVEVPGVGPRTFKMRAVATTGYTSDWSNEVVAPVPFGATGLVGIRFIRPEEVK